MENCIQWWFIDPICGLVFSFASSHSQIMSLFFYLFCCCCCSKAAWNDIHQAISSNWWSIRCIECEWCSKFQRQRRRAKQSKKSRVYWKNRLYTKMKRISLDFVSKFIPAHLQMFAVRRLLKHAFVWLVDGCAQAQSFVSHTSAPGKYKTSHVRSGKTVSCNPL